MANPLKILGISPGSTLEEAKSSFKALSLKYHPDKNSSPDASRRFISIKNAYDTLEKNPSLLDNKVGIRGESLSVEVTITAEELYFSKEKILPIKKLVQCKKCSGTGSEDKLLYVCTMCDGVGHVSNEILEFLGKESKCPLCNGFGITPPSICLTCEGETLTLSVVKEAVPVSPRFVILKDKGNAGRLKGLPGDLKVQFRVEEGGFYFKDRVLSVVIEISPARFILGGDLTLSVLGEEIHFTMVKRAKSQNIVYRGKPIIINYKLFIPPDTEATVNLYKSILENEERFTASFKQSH